MPRASDVKRGDVVEVGGTPHTVVEIDVRSPSARGASTLYKMRMNNLLTGQKLVETFKGDDFIAEADVQNVGLQYSYDEGDAIVFMDTEDYAQYPYARSDLTRESAFLTEGLDGITGLVVDDRLVGIRLPQSVVLEVVDTSPTMKGATANARTKPATLTTGHVVQVPEYVAIGEAVKINTTDGKFMSRA
jgi:elongation factor P